MALALVCTNVPANLHVQTGTETVYAAQETAINSEQDLIAMQNNPKGKVWKKDYRMQQYRKYLSDK